MADSIAAAVKAAAPPAGTPITDANLKALWETIITLLYTDIKANAQVVVAVASVSGVTTGGAVSGPGAGTGTIL